MDKKNICLLVGGDSPEREVSKDTSLSIYKALLELGYQVNVLDPSYGDFQPNDVMDLFTHENLKKPDKNLYLSALSSSTIKNSDLVIIGLHGNNGEDGTVQAALDLMGKKYTGTGILGSSLAMDKNLTKIIMKHSGIKTPKWFSFEKDKISINEIFQIVKSDFNLPCIIKPNNSGSTIGLTLCKDELSILPAIEKALNCSDEVIIEDYIRGREIQVGILGEKALAAIEIKPSHEIYDYECKYSDGMSDYEVPAKLPDKLTMILKENAIKAFEVLHCKNYARVDFIVTDEEEIYFLEVNTLPGMTSNSLVPKMARSIGINFNSLIQQIVENALN